MGLFDQIRQWLTKPADPRQQLLREERRKTDAMAKRLDRNQQKDKRSTRESVNSK